MPRGRPKKEIEVKDYEDKPVNVPVSPIRDKDGAINDMGFGKSNEKVKEGYEFKGPVKFKFWYSKSGNKYYEMVPPVKTPKKKWG